MVIIDKLAWIEIQEGKILSTKSYGKDKFYIPGGKRENGESDIDALKREISEELSVELITDSIIYFGTFEAQADSHPDGVIVKMTCYFGQYNGKLLPASEIEIIEWLGYNDKERVSEVDKIIFDNLKKLNKLI